MRALLHACYGRPIFSFIPSLPITFSLYIVVSLPACLSFYPSSAHKFSVSLVLWRLAPSPNRTIFILYPDLRNEAVLPFDHHCSFVLYSSSYPCIPSPTPDKHIYTISLMHILRLLYWRKNYHKCKHEQRRAHTCVYTIFI